MGRRGKDRGEEKQKQANWQPDLWVLVQELRFHYVCDFLEHFRQVLLRVRLRVL